MSMTVTELGKGVAPDPSVGGEAGRYLVASIAALALDSALLWVGVRALALAPWLAGACSYGAGLALIYCLSTRWVFARRVVADRRREFVLFAILGVIGLLLNSVTLHIATRLGLALAFAKMLSAGVGFVANFVSRRALLFSARRK